MVRPRSFAFARSPRSSRREYSSADAVRSRASLGWAPSSWQLPRRMGSDATATIHKQHDLVVTQGIQQLLVALSESLLLFFVELVRNDIGLCYSKAPTWRVVRGKAAATQAFSFLCSYTSAFARRARR